MEILILVIVATFFYFIPAGVAVIRGHPQALAIFILNLLAGWTFIGWVGAMVWAVMRIPLEPEERRRYRRS